MQTPPWLELITMETLPNSDLKFLASIIGLPLTKQLMCEYPGIVITIPKNATFNARKEYVKKHYDGSKDSRIYLSKICGFSENYIYRISSQR